MCQICWSEVAADDFQLTKDANAKILASCCSYGLKGTKTAVGADCLLIPGATKEADGAIINEAGYGFCGMKLASAEGGTASKTVCCKFCSWQSTV